MRIACAYGLQPEFAAEAQRFAVGFHIRAAIEHLYSVQTVNIAQFLLQAAIIVAERMAGLAVGVGGVVKVYEVLCRYAVVRIAFESPCGDVALK